MNLEVAVIEYKTQYETHKEIIQIEGYPGSLSPSSTPPHSSSDEIGRMFQTCSYSTTREYNKGQRFCQSIVLKAQKLANKQRHNGGFCNRCIIKPTVPYNNFLHNCSIWQKIKVINNFMFLSCSVKERSQHHNLSGYSFLGRWNQFYQSNGDDITTHSFNPFVSISGIFCPHYVQASLSINCR